MGKEISVGLDIGRRYMNMVKLTKEAQGVKLLDFAHVRLEAQEERKERVNQLVRLAQEKAIVTFPVNLGISGESVIVRYIDLPKMKKEEVAEALKYEAQQYIPFKMEEVIFDFHLLGPLNLDQNKMKVLLVAAKQEAIMEFIQFIQEAGLKANLIDVPSFSLVNCFQVNGPQIKDEDVYALLNLEFDLVNINILQGKTPFFTRDISLWEEVSSLHPEKDLEKGIFEVIRPLLANLIREIRLSIDYFESEFEKQVLVIYLSGEGTKVLELTNFFNSQLEREIQVWNPLQNLLIDAAQIDTAVLQESAPMLALACGLALRGISGQ